MAPPDCGGRTGGPLLELRGGGMRPPAYGGRRAVAFRPAGGPFEQGGVPAGPRPGPGRYRDGVSDPGVDAPPSRWRRLVPGRRRALRLVIAGAALAVAFAAVVNVAMVLGTRDDVTTV